MEENPYLIEPAKGAPVPIIISVPHSGTEFPPELEAAFLPKHVEFPEDTDWLVDQLYSFAPSLGITVIRARYSRYVIDLNRDPSQQRLYSDGRSESSLLPTKNFSLESLYKTTEPTEQDVRIRLEKYYWPYYRAIESLIEGLLKKFPRVLLYDAHSIRRQVASISSDSFPDLMLGSNYGKAADLELIDVAMNQLSQSDYSVVKDHIFAGGHITRYFGQPDQGVHALQLERCWDLYLEEDPRVLDQSKAARLSELLQRNLEALVEKVSS